MRSRPPGKPGAAAAHADRAGGRTLMDYAATLAMTLPEIVLVGRRASR